jgi:predicted MFS family arabinose efflux permease
MTASERDITPSISVLEAPPVAAAPGNHLLQLFLLAASLCAGSSLRNLFSPLQETIRLDLGLSDVQIGFIQGIAMSIPITLLSLPFGWLIDRGNRARLLCGLSLCWVGGTFVAAFSHGFALLFLSRMLIGFGLFCAIPTTISLAADLSSRTYRGRAIFPLLVGDIVGAAAAFSLGGEALSAMSSSTTVRFIGLSPWRTVHLMFGSVGLIITLVLISTLREPTRNERDKTSRIRPLEALEELWARRYLLIPLCIGQLGVVMAGAVAGIWSAPSMMRHYGLAVSDVGNDIGIVLLITGLAGAVLGGIMADAGQNSQQRFGVMVGAVIVSAAALPMSFFAIMPGPNGFIALLSLLLLAGAVLSVITSTVLASVIPNELRGMSLSIFGMLNGLAGFGIAPTLVPAMTKLMSQGNALGVALAVVTTSVNIASFLGFTLAAVRLSRERSRELPHRFQDPNSTLSGVQGAERHAPSGRSP